MIQIFIAYAIVSLLLEKIDCSVKCCCSILYKPNKPTSIPKFIICPKFSKQLVSFHKVLLVFQVFDIICDGYTVEPQLATTSLSGPLQCGPK